jgi:hypothetical protein
MRNSIDTVSLAAGGLMSMVVLNTCPFLFLNVRLHGSGSFVDAYTDDSDLTTPVSSSFFKHFLVMSHWFLAWSAPSSPEINHENFTLIVSDAAFFVLIDRHNILDGLIHVSSCHFRVDFYSNSFITFTIFTKIIFTFFAMLDGLFMRNISSTLPIARGSSWVVKTIWTYGIH